MLFSKFSNIFRTNLSSYVKIQPEKIKFDPVFSFPFIKYVAMVNRLKVYHLYGSCIVIPFSGLMEFLNVASESTFLIASYVGITSGVVLSLSTLPLRNIIGHLYLSEDNKLIKISSLGFTGKRIDRIVNVDEWIPILDLEPKKLDAIFLQPQLTDGTKYKLFMQFGVVKDSKRMGEVLE